MSFLIAPQNPAWWASASFFVFESTLVAHRKNLLEQGQWRALVTKFQRLDAKKLSRAAIWRIGTGVQIHMAKRKFSSTQPQERPIFVAGIDKEVLDDPTALQSTCANLFDASFRRFPRQSGAAQAGGRFEHCKARRAYPSMARLVANAMSGSATERPPQWHQQNGRIRCSSPGIWRCDHAHGEKDGSEEFTPPVQKPLRTTSVWATERQIEPPSS